MRHIALLTVALLSGALPLPAAPAPLQYGSFDRDFSIGGRAPIQVRNVESVPGIRGRAVHIPADGGLIYRMDDSVLKKDRGTLSLWICQDATPWGGLNFRDRDADENGVWSGRLHSSSRVRPLFLSGLFRLNGGTVLEWVAMGKFDYYPWIRQLFAGEWHHVALTWDRNVIKLYFDGHLVSQKSGPSRPLELEDTFSLGTDAAGRRGFCGAVDEFKTFDRPLSPEEITREFATLRHYTVELLDYAVIAGEEKPLRFRVRNLTGESRQESFSVAGKTQTLRIAPGALTEFSIPVRREEKGLFRLRLMAGKRFLQEFELIALEAHPPKPTVSDAPARRVLLREIDCTEPIREGMGNDTDSHVADGCRVVDINATGAGFLYRLSTDKPGRPHWIEVDYPDTGRREFSIAVYPQNFGRFYTGSLDCAGIITGVDHRNTGKMQTKSFLFWPDGKEFAVGILGFRAMKNALPPAASKIRLYRAEELPAAKVPRGGRTVSNWDEDPTMDSGLAYNSAVNYKSADLEFWRIKWQRILDYMRYTGMNQWFIKVMSYNGDVTKMEATLQHTSRTLSDRFRVPGWAELGAEMLDQAGMDILVRINNKLFNGDWFAGIAELKNPKELLWIDKLGNPYARNHSCDFNFLRPEVRNAYKKIIAAYRDKFKVYKHFRGISLNEHPAICFGSLDNGYGAWTVAQFSRETGIPVPGDTPTKRCRWLLANAKEEWISWRCRKVAEVVRELAETLRAEGNTHLELQYWVRGDFMEDRGMWPAFRYEDALREAGIDLAQLTRLPGVKVVPCIRPDYFRGGSGSATNEPYLLFSREVSELWNRNHITAVNVFRHSNLEIYPKLINRNLKWKYRWWAPIGSNVQNVADFYNYATPHPNTQFVLEPLTHLVAELDIQDLEHGWWGIPEQGHNELFRRFYTQFRRIPRGRFELVPGADDPVAVRVGEKGFYMVNREGFPTTVVYERDGERQERRLTGGEIYYEETKKRPQLSVIRVDIPEEEKAAYEAELRRLKLILGSSHGARELENAVTRFEQALKRGRYSEARRWLLTSAVRSVRMKKTVSLLPSFNRGRSALIVRAVNYGLSPFCGRIQLLKVPQGCTGPGFGREIRLEPGGSMQLEFPVMGVARRLTSKDLFTLALTEDDSTEELLYNFPAIDAWEDVGGIPKRFSGTISTDTADIRRKDQKRIGDRKLSCRYAVLYDRDGAGLRIYVEAEDPQFLPAGERGAMYRGDSIQIYIDQKNDTPCNAGAGYDDNDAVFQFGLLNGVPELFLEYPRRAVIPARGSVTHKDGKTVYDVTIPKEALPDADLRPGHVIGFSLLVNQRMRDENGDYMVKLDLGGESYCKPANWMDCYLGE